MNKVMNFVKLDFMTIKPYLTLKNLFIVLGVATFLAYSNKSVMAPLSMVIAFITLYMSYPFAVGEQNGIDPLYITLGLDRSTVVLGRYLWAFFMNVIGLILGSIISIALALILDLPIILSEYVLILLVVLMIFTIVQALQIPLYFKLGYAKAKLVAYLPFLLLSVIVIIAVNAGKSIPFEKLEAVLHFIETNQIVVAGAALLIWTGIMYLSFSFSSRWYKKREF